MNHPELESWFDRPAGILPDEVREHVARCPTCSAELAGLRLLRQRARALPVEIAPPRDLWEGIAARLAQPGTEEIVSVHPGAKARRISTGGWKNRLVAAAGVVLMLGGVGASGALLWRSMSGARHESIAETPTVPAGLAAFAASEEDYATTVAMLEAGLAARRPSLSPAIRTVVDENLVIIDAAIDEARRAIADDPESAALPLLLASVYRRKVELLRQVVDLPAQS